MDANPHPIPPSRPWFRNWPEGVPYSINYPCIPLYELLRNTARKYPTRVAIRFYGWKTSYSELDRSTDLLAAALHRLGIEKGSRVALLMPNTPHFIISFFGALKAGATVVSMSPLREGEDLGFELQDSGSETLIALDMLYPAVEAKMKSLPLKNLIVSSVEDYMPPIKRLLAPLKTGRFPRPRKALDFKDLILQSRPMEKQVEVDPREDVAVIQYTGGVTGRPKGVMLTHRNLVANAIQVDRWARGWDNSSKPQERILPSTLCVMPFFHIYGLTVGLNHGVFSGSTLILVPQLDPAEILRAIDRYHPSEFPAIPRIYSALLDHPGVETHDFSRFQHCVSGAAPLSEETYSRFKKMSGLEIIEGYGLTEASPVALCNPSSGVRKRGSVGIPYPDTDARIVDLESGEFELGPRAEGELQIRGPQVMKGYWQMPEETDRVLREGWLSTGDMAVMDEDGFFTVVDRKADMIVKSGFRVVPAEIERLLLTHPAVAEAAVVGVPDPYRCTTEVKAFVVLKKSFEGKVSGSDLIRLCEERLEPYKMPGVVEFRNSLPKSASGKALRRALREDMDPVRSDS